MSVDASGLGTVVVHVYTERDLELIIGAMKSENELELTQDLIISDKILDEGKNLCLLGKESVKSITHLKVMIAENHKLTDRRGFRPPVQLAFANLSMVGESAGQITKQLKQKDEEKLAKEREAEEEADREEDRQIIEAAGDLSYTYAFKGRDWVAPEAGGEDIRQGNERFVSGGPPKKLNEDAASNEPVVGTVASDKQERRITKYMTSEPDDKGTRKVYIEDPEVVQCSQKDIEVAFSADFYTVRVTAPDAVLVLGPVECGRIDAVASKWRLSPGKRLTLTLSATRETSTEAKMKKDWEDKQAKAKAAREKEEEEEEARANGLLPPLEEKPAQDEASSDPSAKAASGGGLNFTLIMLGFVIALLAGLFLQQTSSSSPSLTK